MDTLTTLTDRIVTRKANELENLTEENSSARYDIAGEFSVEIIDTYVDNLSFVETMIFARTLCNTYNVGEAFPAETRYEPLYTADDWREAATSGLFYLIAEAIRSEVEDDDRKQIEHDTFGSESTPEELTPNPEEATQEYDYSDIYTQADSALYNIIEYDQEQIKAIGDEIISDVAEDDKSASFPGSVENLYNADLVVKTLVIDYITDATEFYRWEEMEDTACRESFGYEEFTTVIDTVIGEFVGFFDQSNGHVIPNDI